MRDLNFVITKGRRTRADITQISQYYYPAIAPIVQEASLKYGVNYNLRGSLYEALKLHVQRLTNMGAEPKAVEVVEVEETILLAT